MREEEKSRETANVNSDLDELTFSGSSKRVR